MRRRQGRPGSVEHRVKSSAANLAAGSESVKSTGWSDRTIAVLLVLAAFNLRVFRLDLQSIWSDEGLSIWRASHDLAALPGLSEAGIHPPLYDTLLHFWMQIAGRGEFSTRFLSLFFGVLSLAVIFQVGRLLVGRSGAVLAVTVAAVSPFLIWYSQETRMYSPAMFFSLLAVWAALRWLHGAGKWAWLACYVLGAAAAAYTHYYAWLVIGFLNLIVLLWLWASQKQALRRLAPWVVAQVTLGLVYLPWARILVNKYETYITPAPPSDLASILYQTLVSFALGYSGGRAGATPGQVIVPNERWVVAALASAIVVIAVWGAVHAARTGNLARRVFLPLYVVLPILGIIVLSWGKRDFAPRYLLFAAPAYYLMVGAGLGSLLTGRRLLQKALGALALLIMLGGSYLSLNNYYYDPTYWRDDMRGMVDFINQRAQEGDAVVLNAYYLDRTFGYYYKAGAPVFGLPSVLPADWDQDLARLDEIARKYNRVWVALWQNYFTDPDNRIQGWLDRNAISFQGTQFRGALTVLGYYTHAPLGEDAAPGRPVGLEIGHTIKLDSYRLPPGPVCAGDELRFTVYWRALRPPPVDYTVYVHMVDANGKTWNQSDSQPTRGGFPTSKWPVGPYVIDDRTINMAAQAPPGEYWLEIGMYDLKTMKRLGESEPEPIQARLGPIQLMPVRCRGQ